MLDDELEDTISAKKETTFKIQELETKRNIENSRDKADVKQEAEKPTLSCPCNIPTANLEHPANSE